MVHGEWSGHYTFGFEAGEFSACGDTATAWVDKSEVPGLLVRPLPPYSNGATEAFVRWRGTRIGPGSYGHMSGVTWSTSVDTLLEVRPPAPGDCGAVSSDSTRWLEAMVAALAKDIREIGHGLPVDVVDSTRGVPADPWTTSLVARLGTRLGGPRRPGRDSVTVRLHAVEPLAFPVGESQPLVALHLSFRSTRTDADDGTHLVCFNPTTAYLIKTKGRLTVRYDRPLTLVLWCT